MTSPTQNTASVWKDFERNDITHSVAHYLMAIDALSGKGDCKAVDIAGYLNVSRNAVSLKLKTISEFVAIDARHNIVLTEAGKDAVKHVIRTRHVIYTLLTMLGVAADTAEQDSCKVEHLFSKESGYHIKQLLKYLQSDAGSTVLADIKASIQPKA